LSRSVCSTEGWCYFDQRCAEPNCGKHRKLRPAWQSSAAVLGGAQVVSPKWWRAGSPFAIAANSRLPIASQRRFLFTTYC